MFFDELSNDEWVLLVGLVSDEPAVRLNRRGRPRADPRIVANAVLWILSTGEPWSKLPGRYPSGPTCRRRFEEWQQDGTLAEMVRLLTQAGRTFVYVPEASPPVAAKPAPQPVAVSARDDSPRGVSWKSPESWQSPAGARPALRSLDPLADMTRQLSGAPASAEPLRPESVSSAALVSGGAQQREYPRGARGSLPMSLAGRGTQTFAHRDYVIYVAAERVPNAMFRAWAEIEKDGRRVERSGLVGPRFDEPNAAQDYALEWAQQWIDRQCRTVDAAASNAPAHTAYSRPLPSVRTMPNTVTVSSAGVHADAPPAANAHSMNAAGHGSLNVARSSALVAGMSAAISDVLGGPLNASVSAIRTPLRRYPADAAGDSVGERYPLITEFISHVG
ncbi:transposase [Paraburkholderia sp. DHOC27]|uniref:transposase n=1 Tax=Paraburkholderia sp. DHOC27 TaxID=2303330 RepID=UPI000E3ED950|nr:DUF6566 family protein [Paraburkholderia sp. DHOC27]RFU47716.1 transposase [Paraburkholderia sp. DHOC27]